MIGAIVRGVITRRYVVVTVPMVGGIIGTTVLILLPIPAVFLL